MGGIAVLHPHDVLKNGISNHGRDFIYAPMKSRKNPLSNPKPNPNPKTNLAKSNRRKKSPPKTVNTTGNNAAVKNQNFVMGQVKILKRGEQLSDTVSLNGDLKKKATQKVADVDDLMLSTVDRLGPEPDLVPKQIRIADFYAGSAAFVTSPPPSSLPLPAFFKKKGVLTDNNGDATTDLRRLLKLDF